ncbi:interphotoreceptor retinoid-binding protein [Chitinimonas prasina]|uniref:Interphotoreceptor retinoid-binding protein n=2 Tax=Chitinimonas prasina TaxID=1434937 RepID=A0ABQ5YAB7_9NEIS|nr:interphotoreceptor retinoid-binding protein [Chitinimonas prasina]
MTSMQRSQRTLFAGLLATGLLSADLQAAQPDMTIDAKVRQEVISNTIKYLGDNYVFPDMASKLVQDLKARQQRGEYDKLTSATEFAKQLTADMQALSRDKHLNARYRHEPIADDRTTASESAEELARYARQARAHNYGFSKIERLPGNVGYLKLDGFEDPSVGGATATAAMNLLANSEALIVDLRENGGGSPEMVQWITSYLFGTTPVHLNDLYYRPQNETTQYWTHAHVPGARMADTPVYVLTAKRTFSAAEEFSYNLKNLKRATLVGETTGGGAHPGDRYRAHAHFSVFVPTGRAINPISKTNWEGTGVVPDVAVPAAEALTTAHKLALEKLAKDGRDEPARKMAAMALSKPAN